MDIEKIKYNLDRIFLEKSYGYFDYKDWWYLDFHDFKLNFNSLYSNEESNIIRNLKEITPTIMDSIEVKDIPKVLIVMRNLRKPITEIKLNEDFSLELIFDNRSFTLSSNEEIVDWQWSINKTGVDLYHDCYIGCVSNAEVILDDRYIIE